MKTKAICSFFVLFAIVVGIGATTPAAFAEATIETADTDLASPDPGCLSTEVGCYTPNTLTVDVGHIVTMTNTDETGIHTFTSGTVDGFAPSPDGIFDSDMLMKQGDSYDLNTTDIGVGEFPFYCSLHVWMQGVLIVQEAEAEEEMQMEETMDETLEEETMMEETAEEAERILQLIPEPTPEIIPEPTPELIPEPISEPTPELIPELTPELTPEPTPEPTPEIIPEPTPELAETESPQESEKSSNDESEIITDVSSNNKILWVLVIISFIIMGFAVFKKKTQNQKVENS